MWCPLVLVLLVGAASAEHYHAWKTDTEYQYLVRGRTLAALSDVRDQYTGIVLKALLNVRPKSEEILEAKVSRGQYAEIHTDLPDGWKSEISDSMVDYKQFPLTEKVFEIKMKHGVVVDLIVDKDVPTWEVNVLKSIVSQFQVDTQGENLIPSRSNQEPEENRVNAMYKAMEASVSGKCEVLYDMSPLPEFFLHRNPQLVPKPELKGEGEVIDILKTKNYTNCEQRMSYHFGITGSSNWEPMNNGNGKFMARSSISRIVITGDLKTFTIQSSATSDVVTLSPHFYESEKGMVGSLVNVTLHNIGPITPGLWVTPANPESTGNLVYNYNNPFATPGEEHRPGLSNYNSHDSKERRRNLVNSHEDDSSASRSSKGVDSMEYKDEQSRHWQSRPTLNEAPSVPLLPFFVGNRGKSIQKVPKINDAMANTLARQIGSDLQNPNTMPDEQTLEKFTILIRVLRTMNTQQIAEALGEVYQSSNEIDSHDESQNVRRSTWIAFRDALAQAGTGPALVTIKNLIKQKKIKGIEAMAVVGVLSKSAKTPTPEYMDVFFELATMPETTSQDYLNSTAIVTFAELIRYSQVNHQSAHSRYPVHSFGLLAPKHNPSIFRDYVPYMADQLRQSIEKNELAKSHVYIRAIGNVAHPKILAIFEPYLEGKIPATNFQRLLMVFSLDKLAQLRPRLARGVFYRLYQNSAENHHIRCAAVFLLMSTNPPASMLQRMAEYTNYDHSKHVNAAIKSAIESASELETPESQDLATKARNVLPLLNKESYGTEHSFDSLTDYAAEQMDLAFKSHYAQIGGDHSFIPRAFYVSTERIYGDFKAPKMELNAAVSSVKDFYNAWRNKFSDKESKHNQINLDFSPEKIAKMLKFENAENEKLEGSFYSKSQFRNEFFSYDKYTLQHISEYMKNVYANLKDGTTFNMAKLYNYDVSLSFPLESGLPFVYSFELPILSKIFGSAKGHNNHESIEGSVDLRAVHAMKMQGRLGFVAPFEHQHYIAGIDTNYQVYLPIRAEISYKKREKQAKLKLAAIDKNEKNKLIHLALVPFTTRHDILSMSPVMKDKNLQKVLRGDMWSYGNGARVATNGFNFKIKSEGDRSPLIDNADDAWNDPIRHLVFPLSTKNIVYYKTEVNSESSESSSPSVTFTATIESIHRDEADNVVDVNKKLEAKSPKITSKKINNPERRKQLLEEVAKGIAAVDAYAVDVGVELPGSEPVELIATLAYANSKVDEKSRGLAFAMVNSDELKREVCVGLEALSAKVSMFDMEMAGKSPKRSRNFDMEFRGGQSCDDGIKLRIKGEQNQTDDYRKSLKELPAMRKCMNEVAKGTKSLAHCQDISVKLSAMDKSKITIEFEPKDHEVKDFVVYVVDMLGEFDDTVVSRNARPDPDDNTIEFAMNVTPLESVGTFLYRSPQGYLTLPRTDLSDFGSLAENTDPDMSIIERLNTKLSDVNSRQHVCVVDNGWVTTFDQANYPATLGKCWHVAMSYWPKVNKKNWYTYKVFEDMMVSVLVRDTTDAKKEVKVTLGNAELQMKTSDDKLYASLDGKSLDLKENYVYRHRNDAKDIEFEIFKRADGSIRLSSDKYDVDIIYYGQRVQIKASDNYRDDIRGICGNYDGEPANDFNSPKDCLLTKPKDFVASYALTSSECHGPAVELSRKAEEATCLRKTVRPGNVISDQEAGRKRSHGNWGYHNKRNNDPSYNGDNNKRCTVVKTKVIVEEEKICFSLRPMPTCASGCTATRTKSKVMPMYCIPKGSIADQMADRIKQGANPDLSQKSPSKKLAFDIPVGCSAA